MICKYCGKEISKGEVWNPDRYGNGYHYRCLIEMEFARATRVKKIPLDRIKEAREEMEQKVFNSLADDGSDWYTAEKVSECMQIMDKLIAEVEKKE